MRRISVAVPVFLLSFAAVFSRELLDPAPVIVGQPRTLTLEDRVAAQRAIEEVYWRHRIWPKENPRPKPGLEMVLPASAIRARVDGYLEKSNALEQYWGRAITAGQLQAEIDRMARSSRAPRVLRELFDALGNDPFLIAETLARETLVDRLIRNWYANDSRLHEGPRHAAEAARATCASADCMRSMGGEYHETVFRVRENGLEGAHPRRAKTRSVVLALDPEDWNLELDRLAAKLGGSRDALPVGGLSTVEETADAFAVTALLAAGARQVVVASTVWPKRPFDAWWTAEKTSRGSRFVGPSSDYVLPVLASQDCVDDTWSPMQIDAPEARYSPVMVWTGTEMIVWGGTVAANPTRYLRTGARYDPATDSWRVMSETNVPRSIPWSGAVWTGTEMIGWGGYANEGGRYDPSTDIWKSTSTGANVPVARANATLIWTGTEMIVWGGQVSSSGAVFNTGGRYDPSTDSWRSTSTGANVPAARWLHTAVWTGTEMIVWGGRPRQSVFYFNTGGRYDPSSDTWSATSSGASVPAARVGHTAVWTGTEMIVWGGQDIASFTATGGRYDPGTDTWEPTSTGSTVPAARIGHTAVWTGTEMIVWGGTTGFQSLSNSGARYTPGTDGWAATSVAANVPEGRSAHGAVWTGTEMIVWGGDKVENSTAYNLNSGGRYDPATDVWVPTSSSANTPGARWGDSAVWTGTEMIVWGGVQDYFVNTGRRYDPSTDTWTTTSLGPNVPAIRYDHTAVWTGSEMILWGGLGAASTTDYLQTGGRYSPSADTWSSTSTDANVPDGRIDHAAIWTGTQMIVWGGQGFPGLLGTGSRYDPTADLWAATSSASAPSARIDPTAVWTGTRMVVWGGGGGAYGYPQMNTGSRYDPSTDAWAPTSTGANVPSPRWRHTAVWTGTEMIIWGGMGSGYLATGGRYDPSTNIWAPTATGSSVPIGRMDHTSVWTGKEMIVWGGWPYYTNTGSRYDPATDGWFRTSTDVNVPDPRYGHKALWTGSRMIVFGGITANSETTGTGGLYCACLGTRYYRDADGDGFGDLTQPQSSCDGTTPAGHVPSGSDCDDANASIHPGGNEICNGMDDDCNGLVDVPAEVDNGLRLAREQAAARLTWNAALGASTSSVLRGALGDLPVGPGGGDELCLADGLLDTTVNDAGSTAAGAGFWYLVRGQSACGNGPYGFQGQYGGQDAPRVSSTCP